MVIMFLLGAAATTAAVGSTSAAVAHMVDGCHRLRPERLLPRSKSAGVNGLLTEGFKQVRSGKVQQFKQCRQPMVQPYACTALLLPMMCLRLLCITAWCGMAWL
jgi:hypothetical protein